MTTLDRMFYFMVFGALLLIPFATLETINHGTSVTFQAAVGLLVAAFLVALVPLFMTLR